LGIDACLNPRRIASYVNFITEIFIDPTGAFRRSDIDTRFIIVFPLVSVALLAVTFVPIETSVLRIHEMGAIAAFASISAFRHVLSSTLDWLFYSLFVFLFLLGFKKGDFAVAARIVFAAACVMVLGTLVNEISVYAIAQMHHLASLSQIRLIPNLNTLIGAEGRLGAALGAVNPFTLWFFSLIGLGSGQSVGSRQAGLTFGIFLLLVCVALSSLFSR
jgi:hypothetical protein